MKKQSILYCVLLLFSIVTEINAKGIGSDLKFGIGFSAGVSRLEGDLRNPLVSPMVSGHLRVLPIPYLAISGELGFTPLNSRNHRNPAFTDFKTMVIPFELSAIVNFLPFNKINPYVMAGGGGVYWNATNSGNTIQDGIDSFLKTGGGIEYRFDDRFSLDIGATFRFSFTDAFDQIWSGDERDQVLDAHVGFTYYFRKGGNDKDHDFIPDDLDLSPEIAEDQDGYLDHDGIPEKNPNITAFDNLNPTDSEYNLTSPVVIHHLVHRAESGRDIPINANVYSNIDLRVVAILYRSIGSPNWNVMRMEQYGKNIYRGIIPGYDVTTDGLEYSVVAVDEKLSGIGYSGLPSMPIQVKVSPNGKPWRFLGGTLGAATIGTATYLILRKQK